MSLQKNLQVVNTNCQHFLHHNKIGKDVHLIQPDKFTFLKSNLLVSNIVNKPSSKQKKLVENIQQDVPNSYINCEVQMKKLSIEKDRKKVKLQRVRNLAKCRSQITFQEFNHQQKNIGQMIQNVYILRRQTTDKAGQIMGKKEDNAYLGRNLNKQKESVLKDLKETNPTEKNQKSQTIRLLMKQNSTKCNRKELKQLLEDSLNTSVTKEMANSSSLNSSMQLSFLDMSNAKAVENRINQDQMLRKLIKSKSTDNFMQQQRRRAVWNGFAQHWRKGGQKYEPEKKLKKQPAKKKPKPKFETSDHQILNYNDQYSRYIALKKYENAFAETGQSFQLRIQNQVA